MVPQLAKEIQQNKPFPSLEAEAFLNIVRTADALSHEIDNFLKGYGLTSTQYNLLRILRGAGRAGTNCSAIGQRMIKRDPDITRLLDRMEQRGWVQRARDKKQDRRVVTTTITAAGLDLVNQLDGPIDEFHRRQFEGVSRGCLAGLIADLENIREQLELVPLNRREV